MKFSKPVSDKIRTKFDHKICVITGAASGIGRATAMRLAEAGAILALCDVDADGLYETVHLISSGTGGSGAGANKNANINQIMIDEIDLSHAQAIADYGPRVLKQLGPADYVFNIAGLSRIGNFDQTDLFAMEKVMDVNYWGVVRMTKAFLPQLKQTRGGLINISSVFGLVGFSGQTHYCSSKFAVRGFSETLAQEIGPLGVSVHCVHPGGVATNISRNAKVDHLPEGVKSRDQIEARFDKSAKTSAQSTADIILNGVVKNKRRILVGPDARFLDRVQRLMPQSYYKVIAAALGQKPK